MGILHNFYNAAGKKRIPGVVLQLDIDLDFIPALLQYGFKGGNALV